MDHQEEFLNTFFTQVTQLCFDKAKEFVVRNIMLLHIDSFILFELHINLLHKCFNMVIV